LNYLNKDIINKVLKQFIFYNFNNQINIIYWDFFIIFFFSKGKKKKKKKKTKKNKQKKRKKKKKKIITKTDKQTNRQTERYI